MKKIFIYFVSLILVPNLVAQRNTSYQYNAADAPTIKVNSLRATGDTVFLFDGRYIGTQTITTPPLSHSAEDLDLLTLHKDYTDSGLPSRASYLPSYDVRAPGDTNFYFVSVSYFTSPGTAADWLSFGPIVIPAIGATLSWKHSYTTENYRDGYRVHVNTKGLGASNFAGLAKYTITDNDASTVGDTSTAAVSVFFSRSISLDDYAGQTIYLGIEHNANDQNMLLIDDILITEGTAVTSITEGEVSGSISVYPNPSKGLFTVTADNEIREIQVANMMGQVVYSENVNAVSTAVDISDLNSGIYTLKTISSDNFVSIKEIVVYE